MNKEQLAPVIALALDKAWGNRYDEHAVEELAVESKAIAEAVVAYLTPEPVDLVSLPKGSVVVGRGNSRSDTSVFVKTGEAGEPLGRFRQIDGAFDLAPWEIELVCRELELVHVGRGTH